MAKITITKDTDNFTHYRPKDEYFIHHRPPHCEGAPKNWKELGEFVCFDNKTYTYYDVDYKNNVFIHHAEQEDIKNNLKDYYVRATKEEVEEVKNLYNNQSEWTYKEIYDSGE